MYLGLANAEYSDLMNQFQPRIEVVDWLARDIAKQEIKRLVTQIHTGMSCPSWQWHRTGSSWFPVRTLPVAPLWCDLGFVPNSRGNKAAANLSPILREQRN